MNRESKDNNVIAINTSGKKQKKNIPKNVYIITANEAKSKEIVAKALAEMCKRMLNPV